VNLRAQAESDLNSILKDADNGFGWSIEFVSPAGDFVSLLGFSNDIGQAIDPETGQPVAGRTVTVSVPIKDFEDRGLSLPTGITQTNSRPWCVSFMELPGSQSRPVNFRVVNTLPDRGIGMLVCYLEGIRPG